jgi:hypothetical protein
MMMMMPKKDEEDMCKKSKKEMSVYFKISDNCFMFSQQKKNKKEIVYKR